MNVDQIIEDYSACADRLRPMVADTTAWLLDALENGKRLLFEGAQGSLLDVDHGTFPYMLRRRTVPAAAFTAAAVFPNEPSRIMIGVAKAYTTRVGGGPFPTELDNEIGQRIRDAGNEYGTVTGRPRRCGWLDTVATRYSARISGVDSVVIALLDVLSGFDELKICEAYDINGRITRDMPSRCEDLAIAKPVLRKIDGWSDDITGVRRFEDLPAAAQEYVKGAGELIGRRGFHRFRGTGSRTDDSR